MRPRRAAMVRRSHDNNSDNCGDYDPQQGGPGDDSCGASPGVKGWDEQPDGSALNDLDEDMIAGDDAWFGGEEAALFKQFESRLPAS